jgi:hypothetical protein
MKKEFIFPLTFMIREDLQDEDAMNNRDFGG